VACVFVLTGLFLYRVLAPVEPDEQIVINQLEAKEIRLIYSEKTVLYEDNIDIQIDNKGKATIQSDNNPDKIEEIEIADNTLNTLVVPYGRRSKIELPDGTKAWLNSGSILQFPSTFSGDKREVMLSGEMYIEVKKQEVPFVVKTTDFSVKVLGTKFNVSAYEKQQQSVVLVEGSVGVRSDHVEETCMLSPNEIALLDTVSASFRKEKTDALEYISWVKGYIVLHKTPLINVMNYLERYYNVDFEYIETPRIQSMTCDGKLYLSESFDNVMRAIGILTDTEYSKENNSIYIYNK
jgi:transmembrane sensor